MLTGVSQAMSVFRTARDEFVAKFSVSVARIIKTVHEGVIGSHPVWSGESISAWHWGLDVEHTGGATITNKKRTKAERQQFGHTGSSSIGSEPMRARATVVVNAEFAALKVDPKDPFHRYILANNHPRTEMLEYGELPTSARSRSPGGMIRLTQAKVEAMIGSFI